MWRYVFIGVALISFATQAPSLLQKQIDDNQGEQSGTRPDEGGREIARVSVARAEDDGFNPLAGRVARINRDRSGHYLARARMNGRSYDVLVDTGATMVAINESTARRLGIHLTNADFRYKVNTANGIAEAAKATIDEIEIGRVIVRDVPATVARDGALRGVLLGMSFLNRLKKFEFQSGMLVLTQ
ncbi:MAG: TIGR02281 family clan AA aspartic protease [Nitratireductor sp.]|nr:TIGR02281 family clan AA aspartic protease [Nitratireductor sp.]